MVCCNIPDFDKEIRQLSEMREQTQRFSTVSEVTESIERKLKTYDDYKVRRRGITVRHTQEIETIERWQQAGRPPETPEHHLLNIAFAVRRLSARLFGRTYDPTTVLTNPKEQRLVTDLLHLLQWYSGTLGVVTVARIQRREHWRT